MSTITLENSFTTYRDRLLGYFITSTHDKNIAEDLTQETLITAWENRDKVTSLDNIERWL